MGSTNAARVSSLGLLQRLGRGLHRTSLATRANSALPHTRQSAAVRPPAASVEAQLRPPSSGAYRNSPNSGAQPSPSSHREPSQSLAPNPTASPPPDPTRPSSCDARSRDVSLGKRPGRLQPPEPAGCLSVGLPFPDSGPTRSQAGYPSFSCSYGSLQALRGYVGEGAVSWSALLRLMVGWCRRPSVYTPRPSHDSPRSSNSSSASRA